MLTEFCTTNLAKARSPQAQLSSLFCIAGQTKLKGLETQTSTPLRADEGDIPDLSLVTFYSEGPLQGSNLWAQI